MASHAPDPPAAEAEQSRGELGEKKEMGIVESASANQQPHTGGPVVPPADGVMERDAHGEDHHAHDGEGDDSGISSLPPLGRLSRELLHLILSNLEVQDLMRGIGRTNKFYHEVCPIRLLSARNYLDQPRH